LSKDRELLQYVRGAVDLREAFKGFTEESKNNLGYDAIMDIAFGIVMKNVEEEIRREDEKRDTMLEQEAVRKQ
jgi:hypothetical protein